MTLSDYLAETGDSDAQFAVAIGRERSFVNRLRRNLTKPGPALMEEIAQKTGGKVLPNDWFPELAQAAA